MRNQETKTPLAYGICPVLDLFFSPLFQVRRGQHGSILREAAARSLWVFHHQIQISSLRRSLLEAVPGDCPFGLTWDTCTRCEAEGVRLSPPPPAVHPRDFRRAHGQRVDVSRGVLSDGKISHVYIFPSSGCVRKPQKRKELG